MTEDLSPEDELIEEVAGFAYDPEGFMDFAFPWGEPGTQLEDEEGPREWQRELARAIGKHLQNPATRFMPFLGAIASGHGIGKSADIGMLINWAMSCFEDCKVVYTANTETQLRTKTSPEIGKWFRLSITAHWFKVTATAIFSADKQHEKTWRADAVAWSENNTEAFAGLHNKKKCIVVVFDEGSSIADKVWEVTEGALTDEETVIIWLAFGNPTRATGRFRECFRRYKHRWFTLQVDSRTVEGTNKEQIKKWEEDHGVDSDFFKIRVRGIFPNVSARQFIPEDLIDKAVGKHLRAEEFNFAPKIITLDNAWEGDDEGVIALRQGLAFKVLKVFEKNSNDVQVAQWLAQYEDEEKADAVFIDGGYGTGVASVGKTWNRNTWRLVWFGEASNDPGCLNKRAEMWKKGLTWLQEGGALPDDLRLRDELLSVETVPRMDGKIQLESKKDMKARGLPSPGRGDAWALSFAFPVQAKVQANSSRPSSHQSQAGRNPLRR